MKKLLLLCLLWCTAAMAQSGHAFFIAKIKNHTKDTLYFANPQFTYASAFNADKTGAFVCGELNLQTGLFMFIYNKLNFYVFIESGTTTTVTADENNLIETMSFEGPTEKENNCIVRCLRERKKFEKSADSVGNDMKALRKLSSDYSQKIQRWLKDKKLDPAFSSTMLALYNNEFENIKKNINLIETVEKMKGKPSPGFKFENYDGSISTLENFKGRYVLIDVWATWCGPCMYQLPYLEKLQEQFKDKNIAFLSISLDKKKHKDKWKKFIASHNLKGTQLLADKDFRSSFAKDYSIKSIPRFILLDPDGIVIDAKTPQPSNPELSARLEILLKDAQ